MKRYLNILIMIASLALTACDFRYRYADSGTSPEEVQENFENLLVGPLSSRSTSLQELYDDPNTYMYFAQWERGYQPMGPLEAVAPIDWQSVIGESVDLNQLEYLRVYFLHKIYDDGTSDDVLVLEYQVTGGSPQAQYYSNLESGEPGYVEGNAFYTVLSGTQNLVLESYDVAEGDLDVDIQLRFYSADEEDLYLGKISNLEGFSPP